MITQLDDYQIITNSKNITSSIQKILSKQEKLDIAIDLTKQQKLDADPKVIYQTNFTENLEKIRNLEKNTSLFFNLEEAKETSLDFSKETVKVL